MISDSGTAILAHTLDSSVPPLIRIVKAYSLMYTYNRVNEVIAGEQSTADDHFYEVLLQVFDEKFGKEQWRSFLNDPRLEKVAALAFPDEEEEEE